MLERTIQPLRLPNDQERYLPRRLQPYDKPSHDGSLTEREFLAQVAQSNRWYAILSAQGTGKTSFLHSVYYYLNGPRYGEQVLALEPINLGLYQQETAVNLLLTDILGMARTAVMDSPTGSQSELFLHSPLLHFAPRLQELAVQANKRLVLLLDDFQKLQDEVVEGLAAQCKEIHNLYRDRVTVILAGDDDLQAVRQDQSPLRGIVEPYTLQDFAQADLEPFFTLLRESQRPFVDEAAAMRLWHHTQGYPALCWAIARQLPAGAPITTAMVDTAVSDLLRTGELPWLTRAHRYFATQVEASKQSWVARYALQRLNHDNRYPWDRPGADQLLLKGVARLAGDDRLLTWRNPVAKEFFTTDAHDLSDDAAPALPVLAAKRLRGTGVIHVNLVLNFRHFVSADCKEQFDYLRGSSEYETALDHLDVFLKTIPSDQATFRASPNYQRLQNIATDLNIVRYEAAQTAFAYIYELVDASAQTSFAVSSTLNERLPSDEDNQHRYRQNYVETLQDEWGKWSGKSLQLTRDGLVFIRLEREFYEEDLVSLSRKVVGLENDPVPERDLTVQAKQDIDAGNWDEAKQKIDKAQLAKHRQEFQEQLDRSIQWEIAISMVEMFIKNNFTPDETGQDYQLPNGLLHELKFTPGGIRGGKSDNGKKVPAYPLHDRYVFYVFNKLCDCEQASAAEDQFTNHIIKWPDFQENEVYRSEVHCLLEGILVRDNNDTVESWRFPEIKDRDTRQLINTDLSSWSSELCLLSQDNGVIYYDQWVPECVDGEKVARENLAQNCSQCTVCQRNGSPRIYRVHFSNRPNILYEDYWRSILFGLDYILNLRLLARLVAATSTDDLSLVAALNKRGADDPVSIQAEIHALRQAVVTNTRLLAHLRDVTTPLFIARADYATRKLDEFIRISGIERTLQNAEDDISAINTFLQHHDAMLLSQAQHQESQAAQRQMQDFMEVSQRQAKQDQRQSDMMTLIFSLVGFLFAVLVIPSFWVDLEESSFGRNIAGPVVVTIEVVGAVAVLGAALIISAYTARKMIEISRADRDE